MVRTKVTFSRFQSYKDHFLQYRSDTTSFTSSLESLNELEDCENVSSAFSADAAKDPLYCHETLDCEPSDDNKESLKTVEPADATVENHPRERRNAMTPDNIQHMKQVIGTNKEPKPDIPEETRVMLDFL